MNRAALLALVAACGTDSTTDDNTGPTFTPGVALALHGVAPDCALKKDASGETRTCQGRPGTVLITIGEGNHLREIDIDLRAYIPAHAKVHLVPALQPLLGPSIDQFELELLKLKTGDRTAFEAAGAKIEIVAGGTSEIAPEYSVTLRW
jgi:hypothetical protein